MRFLVDMIDTLIFWIKEDWEFRQKKKKNER
jgi:hypothetical protein